jgi:hypothetical protein
MEFLAEGLSFGVVGFVIFGFCYVALCKLVEKLLWREGNATRK